MNVGYRWLKVNNFIYTYTATTIEGYKRIPLTEVLAYVQETEVSGQFKALRSFHFTAIEMDIPAGQLQEVISQVEEAIRIERMEEFQSLNNSGTLIEEGLQN